MNTNLNDTTPAAPSGKVNVAWQKDGSGNVSANVPLGSASAFGVVKVDGTTITASSGVISAAGGGGGSGALILLEQHTASSSASLDFTTCITSAYDEYSIIIENLIPASDNVDLQWLASTNGGSTYDTGNNYNWSRFGFDSGGSSVGGGASVAFIRLVGGIDQSTSYGVSGSFYLSGPGTAIFKKVYGQACYQNNGNNIGMEFGNGVYKITTAVNAFRFKFSSGNIASGIVRVYGIAK